MTRTARRIERERRIDRALDNLTLWWRASLIGGGLALVVALTRWWFGV
jgi:hypothetical protein